MIQGETLLNVMLLPKYHQNEHPCFAIKKKKKKKATVQHPKTRWGGGYVFVFQIQKREIKMCALARELTESQKQHSECQNEVKTTASLFTKLIFF